MERFYGIPTGRTIFQKITKFLNIPIHEVGQKFDKKSIKTVKNEKFWVLSFSVSIWGFFFS